MGTFGEGPDGPGPFGAGGPDGPGGSDVIVAVALSDGLDVPSLPGGSDLIVAIALSFIGLDAIPMIRLSPISAVPLLRE